MTEAIHRQEIFMLFCSRHSVASPWVGWELETAKQAKSRDLIQIQALHRTATAQTVSKSY